MPKPKGIHKQDRRWTGCDDGNLPPWSLTHSLEKRAIGEGPTTGTRTPPIVRGGTIIHPNNVGAPRSVYKTTKHSQTAEPAVFPESE